MWPLGLPDKMCFWVLKLILRNGDKPGVFWGSQKESRMFTQDCLFHILGMGGDSEAKSQKGFISWATCYKVLGGGMDLLFPRVWGADHGCNS